MAKRKIRQLTTNDFDFPGLVQDPESKYVDKTDLLYELASRKRGAQYFISRPRRFGKSLMLSTLKAMFEGRRGLFKGLAIYDKPWEGWKTPTPVYSFTMSRANGTTYDEVRMALRGLVKDLRASVGLEFDNENTIPENFEKFLQVAARESPTGKIVVLIDEYDEPVAKFLNDLETLDKVRNLLHDFYEKLKSNSGSIRLLMMTGVTKLTKLSVFSGLNHLKDLSMDRGYADKWKGDKRPVTLIGVNFNPAQRNIDIPAIEPLWGRRTAGFATPGMAVPLAPGITKMATAIRLLFATALCWASAGLAAD
ncbi:MAG: AAA family ATPase [Kiritimatiellae bacterium]|nr:AAA family ATPase [Kiritimatiellia bacterium]